MKRFVYIAMSITLTITACAPATEAPVHVTDAVMPTFTSTITLLPTTTSQPSATPVIPTATITPMSVAPTSISPLALNEFNAGTEMKRLNIIGTGAAHDIEFSADGTRFAVATGRGVYLYDGTTFEQNGFIDVNDSVSAIAFSSDGNVLAVAVEGAVSLWNVNSGRHMMNLEGGMVGIYRLAYGHGGYVAAIGNACRGCGSPQQAMILWDAETGNQIFTQTNIWYTTRALVFTPDGKQLFFGGQGGIEVLDTDTGKQIATYANPRPSKLSAIDTPMSIIFNQTLTRLFVTSFGENSKVLDLQSQSKKDFPLCGNYAYLAGNDTDGICSKGNDAILFDLETGEKIKSVNTDMNLEDWNSVLGLSPDSHYLVFGDKNSISVLDVSTEQVVKRLGFTGFDSLVAGVVLVNGGEKHVAAVKDPPGMISLIDLQSGEGLITLGPNCCEIGGFAFAPDRKTVATFSEKILNLWDLSTQKIIYEEQLMGNYFDPIAFSPDGSKIYLANHDGNYTEFDIKSRVLENLGANTDSNYSDPFAVDNFLFNESGNMVALEFEMNYEGSKPVYRDLVTNQAITIPYDMIADSQFPETFALDASGRRLVFGNAGGIHVWDLATLEQIWQLDKHEFRGGDGWIGAIKSLMFSPQSNLLVSVGWDRTTRLWNITTGNELRLVNVCCSASFTPDGRYLVTAGDGVIRVWGIP